MSDPTDTSNLTLRVKHTLEKEQAVFLEHNPNVVESGIRFTLRTNGCNMHLADDRLILILYRVNSQNKKVKPNSDPNNESHTQLAQLPDGPQWEGVTLNLEYVNANPNSLLQGRQRIDGVYNYFIGQDASKWQTGVRAYREAVYHNLWPGIDLFIRSNQGKLKYEFILQPGADPHQIKLRYQGADQITLDDNGNLLISTTLGNLIDELPSAVSVRSETSIPIDVSYSLIDDGNSLPLIGFKLGDGYDPNYPLVIDPDIEYGTLLGGSIDDFAFGVEVDDAGCAYVTGWTYSDDFPVTPGAFQSTRTGAHDVFVTKLNATGTSLVYSTYIGGSKVDEAYAIEIDDEGNAYVCGMTDSPDFPITAGAFQTALPGLTSGFVSKLNADGTSLLFSTYLGGSTDDFCKCLKVDDSHNVYVVGQAASPDFPVTPGAFQTTRKGIRDTFITKLTPDGTGLVYSTLLGGSRDDMGNDMDLDSLGQVYVCGETNSSDFPVTAGAFQTTIGGDYDAFVTKINASGNGLIYSTYLGGSAFERANALEVDAAGYAYITGSTYSDNFPVTPGSYQTTHQGYHDIFVTKLNPSGTGLIYSTYIGGATGDDIGWGIDVDNRGCAIVVGQTNSPDYPVTPDAIRPFYGGFGDAVLSKLNPAGSDLVFSSFSGGVLGDVAYYICADKYGDVYVVGQTHSHDFPATPWAFQPTFIGLFGFSDAFCTKILLGYHPPAPGHAYRLTRYVINTSEDFPDDTQQLDADFFLIPDERKVVYGTVRFPDGTPAPAAVVKFFKVLSGDPEDTCNLEAIGHAITDDCGTFLLGPLPPDVNVVIKIFFLKASFTQSTIAPLIGTATPLDP